MRSIPILFCTFFLPLLPLGAAPGDLLRVSSQGTVEFTDIQDAIDAAADGDVILVGYGTYPGFTVAGKGLAIVAMHGHPVFIDGLVEIRLVPAGSSALLSDLNLFPTIVFPPGAQPAVLQIEACDGAVRIQDCAVEYLVTGSPCTTTANVPAALVSASPDVSFVGSLLKGGPGGAQGSVGCSGYTAGGAGLLVRESSDVALYDSLVLGGRGGNGFGLAGNGGPGARVTDAWLFVGRSQVFGGDGGTNLDPPVFFSSWGGSGVQLDAGAHLVRFDTLIQGGMEGYNDIAPSVRADAVSGPGTVEELPGTGRSWTARGVAVAGDPYPVTAQGPAGDALRFGQGPRTGLHFSRATSGVWLLPFPVRVPFLPHAVVGGTGLVQFELASPLARGRAGLWHIQPLYTDTAGGQILAAPRTVVMIDPTGPPAGEDCNGDGVLDLVEILRGTLLDHDLDLIPDSCGPQVVDWYVDASAPFSGNGSASLPFKNLLDAFLAAGTGHRILVRPGTYTGPQNRDLDLAGRALHVMGLGARGSVVIDMQQADRFLSSFAVVSGTVRLENLVLRNGRADNHSLPPSHGGSLLLIPGPERMELVDCRFEGSSATAQGGALRMVGGQLSIQSSEFEGCTAGTGGALALNGVALEVRSSLFHDNSAAAGGAISGVGLARSWFHGNRFLANASGTGAAVQLSNGALGVLLQDCVLAGNQGAGGALWIQNAACGSQDVRLSGLTVFSNAGPPGSPVIRLDGPLDAHLRNSIVWDHAGGGSSAIQMQMSAGCAGPPALTVAYSLLEGGVGAVQGTVDFGDQILIGNPAFADPAGPDGDLATWLDNDLSLSLASPCIDAGSNLAMLPDVMDLDRDGDKAEPAPVDLLGNPRRADIPSVPDTGLGSAPLIDLGAYERRP